MRMSSKPSIHKYFSNHEILCINFFHKRKKKFALCDKVIDRIKYSSEKLLLP